MNCPYCRKEVPDKEKICPNCKAEVPVKKSKKKEKS